MDGWSLRVQNIEFDIWVEQKLLVKIKKKYLCQFSQATVTD